MRKTIITVTPDFDLRAAATGHGWYDLLPFRYDDTTAKLSHVFLDPDGRPCFMSISRSGSKLYVEYDNAEVRPDFVRRTVRHILRIDDELGDFYELTDGSVDTKWIRTRGAGRLLRSPTVFEDLVKTICTTNCTWSLTRVMVTNLVEKLGSTSPSGHNAFPDARILSSVDTDFIKDEIKAGYRSAYLAELSKRVSGGDLDLDLLLSNDLSVVEKRKLLLSIKGVGKYAAEHMLKLLGHYEHLALDSWVRSKFYKLHMAGEICDDRAISEHYAGFGKWQGLAIWCDVTSDWFDQVTD